MKHTLYHIALLIIALLYSNEHHGQELLTIQEAVTIAMENNFDIKIASNSVAISEKNNSLANAGILPSINGTMTNNNTVVDIVQTQANGDERKLDGARNSNLSYGISLNWTIFDGLRMFARHDQLKELENLSQTELKRTILTKVSSVFSVYYDLVQQKQQLTALDSTIEISKQRLETAKNRYTIGKASKLEVLNAEVDLNTDITSHLRQLEIYNNTKVQLNELLAREVTTDFDVYTIITVAQNLNLKNLQTLAATQNPQLQSQLIQKRIQELQLKQVKANRLPLVQVNTGYNFSNSKSPFGFATQSESQGYNYGFSASLPIFNGFLQNKNEKIASLEVEKSELEVAQLTQLLQAQLASAYQTYLTNLELITLEAKNETIAKENLDITLEKFRIGTITTIEFRAAQLNYVNAKVRYSNAQYLAKLSEIALKELAGSLSLE
ncbi:TolC family protein [Imtechella halotolerans]|uniref:Outer membrane efflux protein n=1 Tax=Imtechella halotolerans K1 TaxID=946077 RepID=I0WID4_9FLAO|nr:TolC family protein [Imtechella halotolerans]EID76150.1 outer membrane efflux protein [Imtechella halotolerans K1]WMQ63337.1 TolC family protein [Imtechella halotolerans]